MFWGVFPGKNQLGQAMAIGVLGGLHGIRIGAGDGFFHRCHSVMHNRRFPEQVSNVPGHDFCLLYISHDRHILRQRRRSPHDKHLLGNLHCSNIHSSADEHRFDL